MKKVIFLLFLFAQVLLLTRCDVINPDEEIPAYIHVDSFELQTQYSTEGSASHDITDAWILGGPEIIGVFELPVTAPILLSGPTELVIRPGIKINGIANTRTFYPFYTPYIINQNLIPGQIDTIKPVVEYLESTTFELLEDFEGLNSAFDTSSLSKTGYEFTTDPEEVFEGNQSLKFTLTSDKNAFEIVSKNSYNLPRNQPVFAELNYKNSNVIFIGLIATGNNTFQKQAVIGINPTNQWKKIYINLSELVTSLLPEGLDFRVFIAGELEADKDSAVILLDNFKLLH